MTNKRRDALKRIALSTAALGIVASPVVAKTAATIDDCNCLFPHKGPKAAYFTNALVQTHDKGRVLFYNDLLADKIVLINFMSIDTDPIYRSTQKLIQVQNILGEQLGKDYFIYSITVDPIKDTASSLKKFADDNFVNSGWSFITGSEEVINGLKQRFFYRNITQRHRHHDDQDCSFGLMRYGNEKVGLWGSVPHSSPPEWITKRLQWITSGQKPEGKPKRRGPQVIVKGKPWLYDSGNYPI